MRTQKQYMKNETNQVTAAHVAKLQGDQGF